MTNKEAIEVIKLALAQVEWDYPMDYAVAFDMAIKALEQEPKTGHWKDIPKYTDIAWECSECGRFTTLKHNYCPMCGAKMVKLQESEDKE
jgi:rRNA maturation endonuclease Nob1